MRSPRQFFVYIMTNGPKAAILYTGITGDLRRRVWQHKNGLVPGFTGRYNLIGKTSTSPRREQRSGRSLAPLVKARGFGMTPVDGQPARLGPDLN